jgi:predicted transcriptional regulator
MDDMVESMIEVSVGVPAELWAKVETAVQEDCSSASALLAEALAQHLSRRARLRSVSAWAWDASGAQVDDLAEVDAVTDATGCA